MKTTKQSVLQRGLSKPTLFLDSRTGFQPLAVQVAGKILDEIKAGTWTDKLPGERALSGKLNISRKTLRKALAILNQMEVVQSVHGSGNLIIAEHSTLSSPRGVSRIGVIAPREINELRPFTTLWIDSLRAIISDYGLRLILFSGKSLFTNKPQKALEKLIHDNPNTFWVISHSNEPAQTWFMENKIPCILAGASHPLVELPNIDLDYFAICRHATGSMLRAGHRRLAFLTPVSQRAGDLESEAGFLDGGKTPGYSDVHTEIIYHNETHQHVETKLRQLFTRSSPPTALLISNPLFCLTAYTMAGKLQKRIPEDISIISRDNDGFLDYLAPQPFRYVCNPATFAQQLFKKILPFFRGQDLPKKKIRIEVSHQQGTSLAKRQVTLDG